MVFQRKSEPKTLTVVPAEVTTLSPNAGSGVRMAESVIGKDMSIEGQSITVRCKGSLRVNGAIAADTVRVFGQVQGAILGAHVVLHPSAQVEGDIHSQSLTIEQGASFDGRSRKVTNAAEVAPQLESPEAQGHAYG